METIDAISKRASTREYKTKPVERTVIEKLVDAARHAPTARAVEPWEFIVVSNKEMLSRFGQMISNAPFIKDAACCIVVYCSDTKYYLEDGRGYGEHSSRGGGCRPGYMLGCRRQKTLRRRGFRAPGSAARYETGQPHTSWLAGERHRFNKKT